MPPFRTSPQQPGARAEPALEREVSARAAD